MSLDTPHINVRASKEHAIREFGDCTATQKRSQLRNRSLVGWLTVLVDNHTMALVEDGEVLGSTQLDKGISGSHILQ